MLGRRLFAATMLVSLLAGCAATDAPTPTTPVRTTGPSAPSVPEPSQAAPDGTPAPPGASPTSPTAGSPDAPSPPSSPSSPSSSATPSPSPAPPSPPPAATPAAATPAQGRLAFVARAPPETPAGSRVSLLTHVFLGPSREVPMERGADGAWRAVVDAPQGTLFQYRYSRDGSWEAEEAFVPLAGAGFPHREAILSGAATTVTDTIAQWEDIGVARATTTTVEGIVTDASTGLPLHDIIVSGGPYQTRTLADGSYRLLGVPLGEARLTFRSDDGSHRASFATMVVSTGARQDAALVAAPMRELHFIATLPSDTPAQAVPRLLGDSAALGLFTNDEASAFSTTTSLPFARENGAWSLRVRLGEGHAFRYVLTLGDDRTNVERSAYGEPLVRALVVGAGGDVAQTVVAWRAPGAREARFVVQAPTDDAVGLATSRWDGAEVLPMWPTGVAREWTYSWYLSSWEDTRYRYVRAGDPQIGVERLAPDDAAAWRTATPGAMHDDIVTSWRHQLRETGVSYTPGAAPIARSSDFDAGIELIDYWRPEWAPLVAPAVERARSDHADTVQVARTWRIGGLQGGAPFVDDGGMNGMPLRDVVSHVEAARAQGLRFALRSAPFPALVADQEVLGERHDAAWVASFLDELRRAFVEDARIAQANDVDLLILANPDLSVSAQDPSVAAVIDARWRGIIAAVRAVYSGPVTTDHYAEHSSYGWYADLDYVGAKFWDSVATSSTASEAAMEAQARSVLDARYKPLFERFGRPVFFSEVAFSSADGAAQQRYGVYAREVDDFQPEVASVASDHAEQAAAMEATLRAMAGASWVRGAHVFGTSYLEHDSKGFSITGKAAERAVSATYGALP